MLSLNYFSDNRCLFHSATLAHRVVAVFRLSSVGHGTSISHWGHCGWGVFPSFKMTTVFRKFRRRKYTRIAVLVTARPGHPSTGQLRGPPLAGKAMQYVRGYSPVA